MNPSYNEREVLALLQEEQNFSYLLNSISYINISRPHSLFHAFSTRSEPFLNDCSGPFS